MRQVLLLRGVNLGPRNRIAMPALRERLTDAGLADVRSYQQSGNVVVSTDTPPRELARTCEAQIAEDFGLAVSVLVRTREELAKVVSGNPLAKVAINPKRYQVSFCAVEPAPGLVERLGRLAVPPEQFVAIGREFYAWHPNGVARSRLWAELGSRKLEVTATARNWTTVTTLLAMTEEVEAE